MKSETNL